MHYCTPIVVCGGRDYANKRKVWDFLDFLAQWVYEGDLHIMTGGARGADTYAEDWAKNREQLYTGVPAQWSRYGKRAGMKRNAELAAISSAVAVVVFQGGRGTLNMLSLAQNVMDDPRPDIYLPDGEFWK